MVSSDDWADALLSISCYIAGQLALLGACAYVATSHRCLAADVALWTTLVVCVLHTAYKTVRHFFNVRVYTVLPKALFRVADAATLLLAGVCVALICTSVRRTEAIAVAAMGNALHAISTLAVCTWFYEFLGW